MYYNTFMAVGLLEKMTDRELRERLKDLRPSLVWKKELYDPSGKRHEIIDEQIDAGPTIVYKENNHSGA